MIDMQDTPTALVILNGEMPTQRLLQLLWVKASLVVCADGAANALCSFDQSPDVIIGDFDSVTEKPLKYFPNAEIIKIEDQETTDGEKALAYCLTKKFSKAVVVGGFGNRLDHSLYNLELLNKFKNRGLDVICYTDREKIFLIEKSVTLYEKPGTRISLVPVFGTVDGVSLDGFRFDLRKETLHFGDYSSISNQLSSSPARINLRSGKLLLIIAHNLLSA